MEKVKKLSILQKLIAVLVLLAGGSGAYLGVNSLGGSFSLAKCESGIATTTDSINTEGLLTFLTSGGESASTTLRCQVGSADQFDLNLLTVATSSSSAFTYVFRFSNNGTDFYSESGQSVNSVNEVAVSDGDVVYRFVATSTTPFFKNVTVPDLATRWVEVEIGVAGADGAVHLQLVERDQNP